VLLLLVLGVATVAARVHGGSLARLARVPFRATWVVPAALGLQLFWFSPLAPGLLGTVPHRAATPLVHVSTYLAAAAFLLFNGGLRGSRLALAGVVSNGTVVATNGGYMPVAARALQAAGHEAALAALAQGHPVNNVVLLDRGTRLAWLADRWALVTPWGWGNVFSPGDLVLALGAAVMVWCAMVHGPAAVRPKAPAPSQPAPGGTLEGRVAGE